MRVLFSEQRTLKMNYFKILVTIAVSLFVANVSSNPWNNNTREHLFGNANWDWVEAFIEDEGFRWRNSFNFKINGQDISSKNWWFNKVVDVDQSNKTLQSCNNFINNVNFFEHGEYKSTFPNSGRSASPDLIHSHLSKIAHEIKQVNNCTSASVAAVTIVIEKDGKYYAFSEMINQNNKPYVATTEWNGQENTVIRILATPQNIKNDINSIADCNIPDGKYSCTEGKILSTLSANKLKVFKNTIIHLLEQAQEKLPRANLNYNSIRLVVLHIGTTMDPCAICTRCFVGISKRINENVDSYFRSTNQNSPTGRMDNTKFLIEVSSNGHYNGGGAYHPRDSWNKYNRYKLDCSHTECAGHDGGEANLINISLNLPLTFSEVANPHGTMSWILNKTFPPYVVFGRADPKKGVISAPVYNGNNRECYNRADGWHLHECKNNLPLVG